jgi:serine/threonine-protein kinase HipA
MTAELVTLLGEHEVGHVRRDWKGRYSFVYADNWRSQPDAYPLSMSMPLSVAEHGHRVVRAFLENLLPDNPVTRDRWISKFHLPEDDLLALLAKVGDDCAGAVRFRLPDRPRLSMEPGSVDWLDAAQMADRLRGLWNDMAAWRRGDDVGFFTLGGAQAKSAFHFDNGRWGVPTGGIPTTHIVKPGIFGYDAHAENEHFCLALAARLGLPVANSRIEHFEDEVAISVERFDRLRTRGGILRIHQEDLCQALSVLPGDKYESDGGPTPRRIVDVIRAHAQDPVQDVGSFIAALVYNWLIAGTDAHAKNYSLWIREGGRVNTAPLYDIYSSLPYDKPISKMHMSMHIAGHDILSEVGPIQWRKLFKELNLEEEALRAAMIDMADCLPDHATSLHKQCQKEGVSHPVIDRLASTISERAKHCSGELRAWPPLSRV